jgi:hypothetical protein
VFFPVPTWLCWCYCHYLALRPSPLHVPTDIAPDSRGGAGAVGDAFLQHSSVTIAAALCWCYGVLWTGDETTTVYLLYYLLPLPVLTGGAFDNASQPAGCLTLDSDARGPRGVVGTGWSVVVDPMCGVVPHGYDHGSPAGDMVDGDVVTRIASFDWCVTRIWFVRGGLRYCSRTHGGRQLAFLPVMTFAELPFYRRLLLTI